MFGLDAVIHNQNIAGKDTNTRHVIACGPGHESGREAWNQMLIDIQFAFHIVLGRGWVGLSVRSKWRAVHQFNEGY